MTHDCMTVELAGPQTVRQWIEFCLERALLFYRPEIR